jgi:hypothetical protein
VEYALGAIVIGLIVLFLASSFGGGVAKKFHCMTLQVGLVKIDPTNKVSMTDAEGCGEAVAALPPPAPLPSDPLLKEVRHHLGDGNCAPGPNGNCGGNLVPEGLSMTVPVKLTQEQLDFANAHGNQIVLNFDGTGVNTDFGDTISFGGASIGEPQNGANSITIDTTTLTPGDYAVTFTSGPNPNGPPGFDFDDYEVNNIQVVFNTKT